MAVNRTLSRPDLGYLRRRPHRGETKRAETQRGESQPAQPTGSLSLAFGPPAAAQAPALTPKAAPRLPTARVDGRTIITPERPMVTLDRRQSAIGSLTLDLAARGNLNGLWELIDGTAGTVSEQGGVTTSPEFGRRSLVELSRGQLLVGLRHVQQLRRLLIVLTDLDPDGASTTTVASLYDGSTAECAHQSQVPALVSLAIYQVEGELVIRREGFGFPSLAEAAKAYGFATRWTPPLSR